jgi:phage shock protein PspC (stress-responsive transcriptional regulator)
VAGGVLAYIGAAHLLPEAQAEDANKLAGIMFVVTFVITAAGLIAFQHAA